MPTLGSKYSELGIRIPLRGSLLIIKDLKRIKKKVQFENNNILVPYCTILLRILMRLSIF
jgi:hypothetical protein